MKMFFPFVAALAFISCSPENVTGPLPEIEASILEVSYTSASFEIKTANSVENAVLCLEVAQAVPSAEDVMEKGEKIQEGNVTVSCEKDATAYVAYFVARNEKGTFSQVTSISFTTLDHMYPWERQRTQGGFASGPGQSGRFEPYDNMLLLYGGNIWRNPVKWDQDRFKSQIVYMDKENKEHWLFDAFLAIEIWDRLEDGSHSASLGTGFGSDSADKRHWQHFIDYWFEPGYGFDALDKAVASAKTRIGEPPTTRKVVVSVPDPIIYLNWNDNTTSSTYWGELDGRTLDFTVGADRLAACKWFVDEVRARWAEAGYENIELYGFYCFSESLVTSVRNEYYKYMKWDQVYPALSDYVHSCNEPMSWIPYNWAPGYSLWDNQFKFDFAMVQPNYEWHPEYSMEDWMERTRNANLSMEFELDSRALEGGEDWEGYRSRFLYYIDMCKELDLYGKAPLSYYMDSNALYRLANSESTADRELYDTLCQFVIGHSGN